MPELKEYHILISHSWDYDNQYRKVKEWLDDARNFAWKDYSVPFDKAIDADSKKELKQKLRNKISACNCIIILSGMYVSYSEWIDYEIDTALEFKKPIVGVEPWGQERVPSKVRDNADKMVGWNADSVVKAVRECAL